jgi:diguanylate cyclase (GGDEF)-like protein
MQRFGALLFGGAAGVTILGLLLPHQPEVDDLGLAVVAALAALTAAVLILGQERLPSHVVPLVTATGTLLVSLALIFNGERHGGPAGGDEMYYLWVVLYAAYFFRPLATGIQVALVLVAYGVALAVIDPGTIAVSRWLSTAGLVIGSAVVVSLLSSRIARLVSDLERTARTDYLTGLPNRLAFEERFEEEVKRAARSGRPLALLLGDLDSFKEINDRLGHVAGDAALAELGRLLPEGLRAVDTAARVGGDEFAVLLPDTDATGAEEVAVRLAESVQARAPLGKVPLTISFGISAYDRDGTTLDELTRAADEALYGAKRSTADAGDLHPGLDREGGGRTLGRRLLLPAASQDGQRGRREHQDRKQSRGDEGGGGRLVELA